MQKSARQLPAEKQVTIAGLSGVKPLLMKGAEDEGDEHDHDHAFTVKKVTTITITANTTCISGSPPR